MVINEMRPKSASDLIIVHISFQSGAQQRLAALLRHRSAGIHPYTSQQSSLTAGCGCVYGRVTTWASRAGCSRKSDHEEFPGHIAANMEQCNLFHDSVEWLVT